jgi:hypothetical protein
MLLTAERLNEVSLNVVVDELCDISRLSILFEPMNLEPTGELLRTTTATDVLTGGAGAYVMLVLATQTKEISTKQSGRFPSDLRLLIL